MRQLTLLIAVIAVAAASVPSFSVETLESVHARGELPHVNFIHRSPPGDQNVPMSIIFKNFRRYPLEQYWDDGSPQGIYMSTIPAMGWTTAQTTYSGHAFKLVARGKKTGKLHLVRRAVMALAIRVVVVEPSEKDDKALSHPKYLQHLREAEFESTYLARTGVPYTASQPPDPPSLPMYAAGRSIGEHAHSVTVRTRDGSTKTLDLISLSPGPPAGPLAFLIEDLLDPEECDHIVAQAEGRLVDGQIGDGASAHTHHSRKNKLTFVNRGQSPLLEAVHQRFADVLNLTDDELRFAGEHLQIVRYEVGEEYQPHYDYTTTAAQHRFMTLLVYLNSENEHDGATTFPRALGDRGLSVRPKQGSAFLFYSMLPDGNMDELALHSAARVTKGVKYACNLWVHPHGRPRQQRGDEL